jgi:hypothetical protein
MKLKPIVILVSVLLLSSCLNLEEEPLLLIQPTATISGHIKNQKIFATSLINVNPEILSSGNIPMIFEFSGDISIFDTNTGNVIDVNTFSGTGLSQAYTVSADTIGRDRFIVISHGTINAFANIGNDGNRSNDKLIATGDFYGETQFIVSDLLN